MGIEREATYLRPRQTHTQRTFPRAGPPDTAATSSTRDTRRMEDGSLPSQRDNPKKVRMTLAIRRCSGTDELEAVGAHTNLHFLANPST